MSREHELQVLTLRRFLEDLAKPGCENYTGPRQFNCFGSSRTAFSGEGCTSACVPCMARQMLDSTEGGSAEPMNWGGSGPTDGLKRFAATYRASAERIIHPEPALVPPTVAETRTMPRIFAPGDVIIHTSDLGWVWVVRSEGDL